MRFGSVVVSGYFRDTCFGSGLVFAGEVGWRIVYVVFQVGFWVLDELAWVGFSGLLPDYRYSGFAGVLRGWLGLMWVCVI